jgi:hypothetical protein
LQSNDVTKPSLLHLHLPLFEAWYAYRYADTESTLPKGPKGEKRPADVISAAVKVMRIATGEEAETEPNAGKNAAAVALGKLGGARGGKARANAMTPQQRKAAAQKAARSRWKDR